MQYLSAKPEEDVVKHVLDTMAGCTHWRIKDYWPNVVFDTDALVKIGTIYGAALALVTRSATRAAGVALIRHFAGHLDVFDNYVRPDDEDKHPQTIVSMRDDGCVFSFALVFHGLLQAPVDREYVHFSRDFRSKGRYITLDYRREYNGGLIYHPVSGDAIALTDRTNAVTLDALVEPTNNVLSRNPWCVHT